MDKFSEFLFQTSRVAASRIISKVGGVWIILAPISDLRRLSRSQYARHTLSGHLWPMNRQQCSSVIPHISRQMIHSLLQIKPSATLSIHCRCQRTEELTLPIYRVVHIFLELFWIFYQLTPAGQIIFVCVQTFERGKVF